jgi:hypothetical protein
MKQSQRRISPRIADSRIIKYFVIPNPLLPVRNLSLVCFQKKERFLGTQRASE